MTSPGHNPDLLMYFDSLYLCHRISDVHGQALYPAVSALLENARSPHFIHCLDISC